MRIYWSSRQIPGLAGVTRRERKAALRRFRGYMLKVRVTPFGAAAWLVLVGLLGQRIRFVVLSRRTRRLRRGCRRDRSVLLTSCAYSNCMGHCIQHGEFRCV